MQQVFRLVKSCQIKTKFFFQDNRDAFPSSPNIEPLEQQKNTVTELQS